MAPLVGFVAEQRAPVAPVTLEAGEGYTWQELDCLTSALEACGAGCTGDEPFLADAFGGRRRCDLCGIETRTPLCMHQHVASRQHCLAVGKKHLELTGVVGLPLDGLRELSTRTLRAQVPEPPDVALWELYGGKAHPADIRI